MSKKCINPTCGKTVPKEREYKSDSCSNPCSYEVKKLNQKRTYRSGRKLILKERQFEEVLASLYRVQQAGVKLLGSHLARLEFDKGFSIGMTLVHDKIVAKVIGKYAYNIDCNDNLKIWKLDTRQ